MRAWISNAIVVHLHNRCAACAHDGSGRTDGGGRTAVQGLELDKGELVETGPELSSDTHSSLADRDPEESGTRRSTGITRVPGKRRTDLALRTPIQASRLCPVRNIIRRNCPLLLGLLPLQGPKNIENRGAARNGSGGSGHDGRGTGKPATLEGHRFASRKNSYRKRVKKIVAEEMTGIVSLGTMVVNDTVGKPRVGLLLAAVFLLVLVTVVSASLFGPYGPTASQASCATVPPSSTLFADWAYTYSNLTEVRNAADRIVEGVIVDTSTSGCELIFTYYTVKIIVTVKGNSDSSLITVAQTGGVIGNSKQEVRDDPLMEIGERVILFLNFDPQNGIYGTLGGPQGRLIVTNHLVYSLNVLYPDRNIDIINWRISGLPETALWDQLR